MSKSAAKRTSPLYTRYPLSSVLIYNGATIGHYALGGTGIILGYDSWVGGLAGAIYLAFAFFEMYLLMPLRVCPNCVYCKLDNSRCVSALNLVSRRLASPGNIRDFGNRGRGTLCSNNLYLAALAIPIIAIVPALAVNFSFVVLGILLAVVGLLVFRFFFIFTRVACIHCRAKNVCPNARSMGMAQD